jgi:hypothetical protein
MRIRRLALAVFIVSIIPLSAFAGTSPNHFDQPISGGQGNPQCQGHYGATSLSGGTCRTTSTGADEQIRFHEWAHSWEFYLTGTIGDSGGAHWRAQCVVRLQGYSDSGFWARSIDKCSNGPDGANSINDPTAVQISGLV